MVERPVGSGAPHWDLLTAIFGDPATEEIVSERRTVESWCKVEASLAWAEADAHLITESDAREIEAALDTALLNLADLWEGTKIVGYPILPLLEQVCAHSSPTVGRWLHYGATTQDIMDTALSLQLLEVCDRLLALVQELGDTLAVLVSTHSDTVMAGRTHGQHAVPTTFGAKIAVHLDEFGRQRARLTSLRQRLSRVSLHGAAGTSAYWGSNAPALRKALASRLGLGIANVPWHVARDTIAEYGWTCSAIAQSCARFARNIIALSATEVGEASEGAGEMGGASSTMPQKANPVRSEAIVGMAAIASGIQSALGTAMTGVHERSAGEWQVEWYAMPALSRLAAGALANALWIGRNLTVHRERMLENLNADRRLIMSEAYAQYLSRALGRQSAYKLVGKSVREARQSGLDLRSAIIRASEKVGVALAGDALPEITPEEYLGECGAVCAAALEAWGSVGRTSGGRDVVPATEFAAVTDAAEFSLVMDPSK